MQPRHLITGQVQEIVDTLAVFIDLVSLQNPGALQ
jgi:hypothetical protein